MKISFIIGTRPELIKVAPIILELLNTEIPFDIVNTAQHKDLLEPYWNTFGIKPTHVLDLMVKGQTLTALTTRAVNQIQQYLDEQIKHPDIILAQGDTTTVMAASMVSFYNSIKFAHLEAGLRSFDFKNPFPEEYNRKIASICAEYHFCPTETSKQNLINENIEEYKIHVVGNTVIDALNLVVKSKNFELTKFQNEKLNLVQHFEEVVLITCHRRENQGDNLNQIINAIFDLTNIYKDTLFIWALHPNPNVGEVVKKSLLGDISNVLLVPPLEYLDLLKILKLSFCVISDSGGIQEESPSFNTPVIILRETTERPEGVKIGISFLTGPNRRQIIETFIKLKNQKIHIKSNPYGDGLSSGRIIEILRRNF